MSKAATYTLGCKVNQYDTQAMTEILLESGYEIVPFHEKADVYIINTCTVTNIADRKSRQAIARAVQKNPQAIVCVAGCMSQRAALDVLSIEGVAAVIGTANRKDIVHIIEQAKYGKVNAVAEGDASYENLSVGSSGEMTRGYVKIQEGCNNYCAYCIIPYVRGTPRSRPTESILQEVKKLSDAGVQEVVLTGINISAYRAESGQTIVDVLEGIEVIKGVERIRLGSLEPGIITQTFIDKLSGLEKLCPHFHVSLQSGSDSVLRRMNRKYTAGEYAAAITAIRNAFWNPAITTDVITGFPGETAEEFEETLQFVKSISFSRLHVFPYSERTGTKAAGMDGQIPIHIRKERANELIAAGRKFEQMYQNGFIGKTENVLFERSVDGQICEGHTERYLMVRAKAAPNTIKKVLLHSVNNGILYGDVVQGG